MTLQKMDEGVYIDSLIKDSIQNIDGIIFDCDGVLIDVTKSYDLAIQKTTEYVIKNYSEISNPIKVSSKMIDGFKATGGFNDEVDLTYAAILSIIAAGKLGKDPEEFIFTVIENSDSAGITSVEKFLANQNVNLSEIKKILDYPGPHHNNLLYEIFDQMFYGPQLYEKLFNKKSKFSDPGLIENDKVLLGNTLLNILKKKFSNKIAIVSGRGIESIRYSLKEKLDKFDVKNSAFLEDEPREMAKPNPKPLIRTITGIESSYAIFVGDSVEDLIMANEATKQGHKTIFCGIIGTSKDPEQKRKLFEQKNVELILDSIDYLPKVINQV